MKWRRIHLCTGLLERDGCILLVENRYPNLARTLWNVPGGRQEPPETVEAAVVREFAEETSLAARVTRFAYVAESFDHATSTQFTNFAFHVEALGDAYVPPGDAHTIACDWVPITSLAARLTVRVVREPLLCYLADPRRQYFGYADSGITIQFADEKNSAPSERGAAGSNP